MSVLNAGAVCLFREEADHENTTDSPGTMQGNIASYTYNVRLGMVLKVSPIPPVCRGSFHKVDNAVMKYMVPLGCAAHGEVSKIMLQPACLSLHRCKQHYRSQPWQPRRAEVPQDKDGQHLH